MADLQFPPCVCLFSCGSVIWSSVLFLRRPGGGVASGAGAQEENIFRRTGFVFFFITLECGFGLFRKVRFGSFWKAPLLGPLGFRFFGFPLFPWFLLFPGFLGSPGFYGHLWVLVSSFFQFSCVHYAVTDFQRVKTSVLFVLQLVTLLLHWTFPVHCWGGAAPSPALPPAFDFHDCIIAHLHFSVFMCPLRTVCLLVLLHHNVHFFCLPFPCLWSARVCFHVCHVHISL